MDGGAFRLDYLQWPVNVSENDSLGENSSCLELQELPYLATKVLADMSLPYSKPYVSSLQTHIQGS